MGVIDQPIGPGAYETIRNRIAVILKDELLQQAALDYDDPLDVQVFLERYSKFQLSECPAINICLSEGEYKHIDKETTEGHYMFFITCHSMAVSEDTSSDNLLRGDTKAVLANQRLINLVRAILSDPRYEMLGFELGVINHAGVQSVVNGKPQSYESTHSHVSGGISFLVRANEDKLEVVPRTLDGFDTQVQIGLSDEGYLFAGNNVLTPSNVCDPASVYVNGSLWSSVDSGGTLDIPVVDTMGYPVGAKSGDDYEIDDVEVWINETFMKGVLAEGVVNFQVVDTNGDQAGSKTDDNTWTVPVTTTPINTANNFVSGQTTSFRTGDDGDTQRGRSNSTLSGNNIFGNTNRFTDTLGTQVYANDIVLDHGQYDQVGGQVLGIYRVVQGPKDWNDQIDDALTLTIDSFTGWALINEPELTCLLRREGSTNNYLNYAPFNIVVSGQSSRIHTSTRGDITTRNLQLVENGNIQSINKTNSSSGLVVRYFTLAELGL